MSKKYTSLTFKGICMNFLLELQFFILSRPLHHKVFHIHMRCPVCTIVKMFLKFTELIST